MVFAMHQIQVATIVRHLDGRRGSRATCASVVGEQRLIASVTSEIGTGGDMGRSIAAGDAADGDGGSRFEKQAPTVSYGAYADDLFTTAAALPGRRARSTRSWCCTTVEQTELEPTGTWDTIGMRGTCSPGFVGPGAASRSEQILAAPFADGHERVPSCPLSHILWSHVWLGIATEAFERGAGLRPGRRAPQARRAGAGGAAASRG